jgi:hypothetical protein
LRLDFALAGISPQLKFFEEGIDGTKTLNELSPERVDERVLAVKLALAEVK